MPNLNEAFSVGQQIREYTILEHISHTDVETVFRARHVFLDEDRCFKIIRTGLANDPGYRDRFIHEAKLFSKLRHENLERLFEFGTLDENTFFIVSEFIRGETVEERIKRAGKIPYEQSIGIIRDAAEALQVAHKQKLVHNNLSAGCLVLVPGSDGKEITKLINFSLAKPTIEEKSKHGSQETVDLNLEYSSPENFMDEKEVDQRSDIYSLGVTLFYMLAGRLPFQGSSPMELMEKHLQEEPEELEEVPPMLNQVLKRALAKNKVDRHPFIEELLNDLDRISQLGHEATWSGQTVDVARPKALTEGFHLAERDVIEKKIGEGGMGTVYKAHDRVLNVPVALKTIKKELTSSGRTVERLKREVILARKVAHPNVCRIYDIGVTQDQHYVTMEFLEGRTLADILDEQRSLPVEFAIPILKQVLLGLAEAHRVGIVHRDLKPQNILVDVHGRAFIMDFGISLSEEVSRVTDSAYVVGTPDYMSPEQFTTSTVDSRSDIYSMGILMFEMFTGRLPFEAETPAEIMNAHVEGSMLKPSQVTDIHPHLEKVIQKAMERDPQNRYQSVSDLLNDLAEIEETPYAATVQIAKTILLPKNPVATDPTDQPVNPVKALLKSVPLLNRFFKAK
jgi:serine/threonine protein kinase